MLTHLAIRNLALIEILELEPQAGFTTLTGETGAGKSMLMDALALVLGARADAGLIRRGATTCEVTATFALPASSPMHALLDGHGVANDGDLLLRRQLKQEGDKLTSRAWVNGTPVTVATLAALGEHLVDIHGQHGTLELTTPAAQREVLDAFAHANKAAATVAATHAEWRHATDQLSAARAATARALADRDLRQAWLAELEALGYQPGEEETLHQQRQRLVNAESIRHHLASADAALGDEQGATACLSTASRAVTAAAAHDATLAELAARLESLCADMADAAHELARAANGMDGEEGSLESLDDRLHALKAAARKHQVEVADLPAVQARLQAEETAATTGADHLAGLETRVATARTAFEAACATLTHTRTAALPSLHTQLHAALAALHMPHARCEMQLAPRETADWTCHGAETISLMLAANPGQPLQPLAKVASGGELSRLMLALKQVFAAALPPHTMVLDEIDAGLSGATAHAVGQAMQALAATHQVISITHHAQVAALASHHWQVAKHTDGTATTTTVQVLDAPSREAEVARLLSGATVTDTARAAARELLAA